MKGNVKAVVYSPASCMWIRSKKMAANVNWLIPVIDLAIRDAIVLYILEFLLNSLLMYNVSILLLSTNKKLLLRDSESIRSRSWFEDLTLCECLPLFRLVSIKCETGLVPKSESKSWEGIMIIDTEFWVAELEGIYSW